MCLGVLRLGVLISILFSVDPKSLMIPANRPCRRVELCVVDCHHEGFGAMSKAFNLCETHLLEML